MSVIAQFKDTCVFPTTAFVFESYLKGDTLLILFKCYHQRPKKSELSGWQLSTHKNFPDKVRKSFSRQKSVCKFFFFDKKSDFPDHLEIIQIIRKLFRLSGSFPG